MRGFYSINSVRPWSIPISDQLTGVVEIDESTIPYRTRRPIGSLAAALSAKLPLLARSVFNDGRTPGRIRLAPISDYGRKTLHDFVTSVTTKGRMIWTDGNASYADVPDREHASVVIGKAGGARVHAVDSSGIFRDLKRFGLGVYHGFQPGAICKPISTNSCFGGTDEGTIE